MKSGSPKLKLITLEILGLKKKIDVFQTALAFLGVLLALNRKFSSLHNFRKPFSVKLCVEKESPTRKFDSFKSLLVYKTVFIKAYG